MVPAHCGLNTYFVLPKREAEAEACGRRKQNQQMSLLRANMSGECGGRCQLEIVTPRIVPRRGAAGNLRNGHVITSTIIMTPSLHQQITCPQVEMETNLAKFQQRSLLTVFRRPFSILREGSFPALSTSSMLEDRNCLKKFSSSNTLKIQSKVVRYLSDIVLE